ncbi:hypothetical protein DYB32_005597 [Aphanomyces invadans]|uniref:HTH CENPB-type domain-containing protein n=1 Tax=Aphanomyces invadans TaxID=157072 RepID=A0A3R6VKQ7_9STRA|nr:hypothetical protein DYB32_005597 [Aphanomyces invadans]
MEDDSLLMLPPAEDAPVTDMLHGNTMGNEYDDNVADEDVTSTKGTRKRERLTLGQKRQVVDLAASNQFTHRELAEKFQVGRTTITNICKNTELIRHETDSADMVKKKRKTTKCSYDLKVLDEALHKWRMETKVSNPETKLTGAALQGKAMQLAQMMLSDPYARLPDKVHVALSKFSASNGWLDGYRTRFGSFTTRATTSTSTDHGQPHHAPFSASIKTVDFQTRQRELHHMLENVDPQDIWTGTEFAIASKPPPPQQHGSTATHPVDGHGADHTDAGGTSGGSRLTIGLFVNAAGESFDLQVIGTDRNSAASNGGSPPPMLCTMANLDLRRRYRILYDVTKSGYQVAHTFMHVLKQLNAVAKARKRTFHVLLDSAIPHVKAAMLLDSLGDQRTFFHFESLRLVFLPPNFHLATCHPCHLGLISSFKARFRYEEIDALFARCRDLASLMDPQLQWTFKNVLHWLSVALHSLRPPEIVAAWVASGLLPSSTVATSLSRFSHVASPSTALQDLQRLLADIAHQMPPFLPWVGLQEPNAQLWIDLDGKASVVDAGVDDAQIVRSVLLKHGYLELRPGNLDEAVEGGASSSSSLTSAATNHGTSSGNGPGHGSVNGGLLPVEVSPTKEQVWHAIDLLKRHVRVTPGLELHGVDAVVALNALKTPTANNATSTNTSFQHHLHHA